jgi:hypothetical protein
MHYSFETAAILDFIISMSFYSLISYFSEFFNPKNIGFDTKIIALLNNMGVLDVCLNWWSSWTPS